MNGHPHAVHEQRVAVVERLVHGISSVAMRPLTEAESFRHQRAEGLPVVGGRLRFSDKERLSCSAHGPGMLQLDLLLIWDLMLGSGHTEIVVPLTDC